MDQEADREKCTRVREMFDEIEWNCEVLKNYADVNMGCRERIPSGLDWVFEQVEEAIILEDDCVPHPSFFRFAEELLCTFRYDDRVMLISGMNPPKDLEIR